MTRRFVISACNVRRAAMPLAALVLSTLLLLTLLCSGAAHAQTYQITSLHSSTSYGRANGVNQAGQAAGFTEVDTGHIGQAYRYSGGLLTELGTLGGSNSVGYGINEAGDVVGYAKNRNGYTRAFLYRNGQMSDILPKLSTKTNCIAYAVNDANQIVGEAAARPFLWSSGTWKYLPGATNTGPGSARVLNINGIAAGYVLDADGTNRAAVWSASGSVSLLPEVPGTHSNVYGINDAGVLVGSANAVVGGPTQPVAWRNGALEFLPLPEGGYQGTARDINGVGQIVGTVSVQDPVTGVRSGYSVLWDADGTIHRLQDLFDASLYPGWTNLEVSSISENGRIAGFGYLNGYRKSFMMAPVGLTP